MMFIPALFKEAEIKAKQYCEQDEWPLKDERLNTLWFVYITKYYSAAKRMNWNYEIIQITSRNLYSVL